MKSGGLKIPSSSAFCDLEFIGGSPSSSIILVKTDKFWLCFCDKSGLWQGEQKGGTGSADLCNSSAESADPYIFKVKSESAKGLAENEQKKSFSIR